MVNERFVRDPSVDGDKLRSRPGGALAGDFLGRLWTLFGAPDLVGDGGFTYGLRDRRSGLGFTAYSGPSGPAYGGDPRQARALAPVLDDFDALLDGAPLADCALEFPAGSGRFVIGVANGEPFEKMTDPVSRTFRGDLARARRRLGEQHVPMAYFEALAHLHDAYRALAQPPAAAEESAYRDLARELWTRAAAGTATALEEQLASGEKASRNLVSIHLDTLSVALRQTAADAGVDWPAFAARHAALFDRARAWLKDSRRR